MKREPEQATSTGGAVATAFPSATEAGAEILRSGGNAIDAAVAAAWALSVCEPSGSGLGGQTTLLIRLANGSILVIDGHSRAPEAVSKMQVSREQQRRGYRACTVPSTPATLETAWKRYGVLTRSQVMAPAIRLAEEGYAITKLQRRQAKWCEKALLASSAAAQLFLREGCPLRVGETFRQPELAATLRRLAEAGAEDFYRGRIAHDIADDMARHAGLITEKDLAQYDGPLEGAPLTAEYRGYRVVSVPPPGGGLQVLLGLKILEHFTSYELARQTERWYEILAEVVYAVFRERKRIMPHPEDSPYSPAASYLSKERASGIARRIEVGCREDAAAVDPEEPGETTHLCTADGWGNVVALTQSIQSLFGAKVAHSGLGFLYNNYLCTCKRRPHPYQLGSRCVPLSNAAPTLVLEKCGGEPLLVLGAAGSRRIESAILHVISGVIDRVLSLEEAVRLPRIHGLLSRKVYLERPAATGSLLARIEPRFRQVILKAEHSYSMGGVQALQFGSGRPFAGMADPRRDGTAIVL